MPRVFKPLAFFVLISLQNPKTSMTSINEILSDELKVTPLREGETAEFRLIMFGQYNPQLEGPLSPALRSLAGRCDINDPFDKTRPTKQIANIDAVVPIVIPGQAQSYKIQVAPVIFPASGGIICNHQMNNLYMYLKRHNKNADNPYRNTRKEKVFFEVNEKKELELQNNLFEYKTIAGFQLVKATDQEIFLIAERFNKLTERHNRALRVDVTLSNDSIRKNLQNISQTNPAELILATDVEDYVARVMIDTAIDQRWIIFDSHPEKLRWEWMRKPLEKGAKIITKIDEGADPKKSLAAFLTTKEGSIHFAELKVNHARYYSVKTV